MSIFIHVKSQLRQLSYQFDQQFHNENMKVQQGINECMPYFRGNRDAQQVETELPKPMYYAGMIHNTRNSTDYGQCVKCVTHSTT